MSQINFEQQRKRAKDLLRAYHEKSLEAALRIARHLPREKGLPAEQILASPFTLSEAQFVIAREAGFASWPKLKRHIEAATRDISDVLIDAALQGDPDFLAEVLSRHPAAAQNSIHAAAAIADQDSAFALLAANPRLADQPGGRRAWRPLLYLCYGRSPADEEKLCAIARRLLDLGASPSGREPGFVSTHGTTLSEDHALLAIEAAASRRASVKLVRLLLDAGADLKQTTSALLQAVRGGNTEVLKILLDALPSEVSWQEGWALQEAVVRRRKEMLRILAAHAELPAGKPLLDAITLGRDREYLEMLIGGEAQGSRAMEDAFREAIRCANSPAAEFLRSRGATGSRVVSIDRAIGACISADESALDAVLQNDPHLAQDLGNNDHRMLAWAIRAGRSNAVKLLLKSGLDPNVADLDGQTPLHLAVTGNSLDLVDTLLRSGAKLDTPDFEDHTPLDLAVGRDQRVVQRLLQAGNVRQKDIPSLDPDDRSALFESAADAVASGDIETLNRLLDREPDLMHARSPRPHRAMLIHYVGANGVEEERQRTPPNAVAVTQLLVERGADVNVTCALYGGGATTMGLLLTSIHPLRAGVHLAIAEILLKAGACLDSPRGVPGLSEAAALGRIDDVKTLLAEKAWTKRQIQSAFMWACGFGRTRVVELLLEKGASVREQDGNGQTGLHAAALAGHLGTVKALLKREPPLELRNVWGGAVLDHALWASIHHDPSVDYAPVVEALIRAGADVRQEYLDWIRAEKLLWPASKPRIEELLYEAVVRSPGRI
jgi:ankyrin repeat protein